MAQLQPPCWIPVPPVPDTHVARTLQKLRGNTRYLREHGGSNRCRAIAEGLKRLNGLFAFLPCGEHKANSSCPGWGEEGQYEIFRYKRNKSDREL